MNAKLTAAVAVLLSIALIACAGGASANKTGTAASQTAAPSIPYFTGDGGKGRSITILPPRGVGLAENQAYLPDFVANELVSNFSTFSAMTLFDRVNNQKQYDELLSGLYDDNDAAGLDLGHLTSTEYMLLGDITRTSSGFALQLTVNRNSDKTTAATFSGAVSLAELDDLSGVRRASLDLLQKMGVQVTERTRMELSTAASANRVNAQTAVAQGITAQRQGTEVAALSYYFQAAAFDPSLMEAANRASVMSANISSGNIGDDVRNDIQWRRDWVARLTETEQYFDTFNRTGPISYTLFYSNAITRGDINYQNETVTLSIQTNLHGTSVWALPVQNVLRAVYDGLNATGRKAAWGLDKWPGQGVTNLNPFTRQAKTFTVTAELVNSRDQVIGRQTFQTAGWRQVNPDERPITVSVSPDAQQTVAFANIKADNITGSLTIRIANVNGTDAETAARNGVLQIKAIPNDEFNYYSQFEFIYGEVRNYTGNVNHLSIIPDAIWDEPVVSVADQLLLRLRYTVTEKEIQYDRRSGEITGYTGNYTNIIIPSTINGVKMTKIGADVFRKKGLTSITIPAGVTSIGYGAFADNRLTSVTIPAGVTSIGNDAFAYNQLTNVTIPAGVTSIGWEAFAYNNQLTSITIGVNVKMDGYSNAFNNYFPSFYNRNGKKAGVYTYTNGNWNYSPR